MTGDAADMPSGTNAYTDFETDGAVVGAGAGTDTGGDVAAPAVEYLTGGWVGIAGPGAWLLVEAGPAHPTVQECWRLVCAGAGASRILTALDERMDGEVRGFALVTIDGESTHAAARGSSSIRLQERENGSVTLVLGEVTSGGPGRIVDRLYDWPAVTFQLAAGYEAAWPPRDDRPLLPVAAGIVLASGIAGRVRTEADAASVLDSLGGQGKAAASGLGAVRGGGVSAAAATVSVFDLEPEPETVLEPGPELELWPVGIAEAEPELTALAEPDLATLAEPELTALAEPELTALAEPGWSEAAEPDEPEFAASGAAEADSDAAAAAAVAPVEVAVAEAAELVEAVEIEPASEAEPERLEGEQPKHDAREFDFEFPAVEAGSSLFGDESFFGTPVFTDEADASESVVSEAEIAHVSSAPTSSEETAEQEFGFASAETATRPAPEYEDEEELFLSGPRTVRLRTVQSAAAAPADFTPTVLPPLPTNEIEADDPDFAPTMLVPSRPVMPPVPPTPSNPPAQQTSPAPISGEEQDDPDFAPTMLVPSRPATMPPTPAEPAPASVDNSSAEAEDPDFAPTMLVPARPVMPPTPSAPVYGRQQSSPDFAPTMLVPQANLTPSTPSAPPPDDFAPPAGPRYDVGSADAAPTQAPAQSQIPARSGGDDSTGQESDEDMIWKLDWWQSNGSSSDEPSAYGEPFQSQPPPQPPAQPHLPAPPPTFQPSATPKPIHSQPQPHSQPAIQPPAPQPAPPQYHPPAPPAPIYQQPQTPPSGRLPLTDYEEDSGYTIPRPSGYSSPESDAAGRPLVPAVRCPAGHLNPPQGTHCRVCGIPVPPQESYQIPQPVLGVLRLSTGGDVPLDRDIFLGRDPSSTEDRKARKPHMLRLPSPGKDISRDHLEIRLIGWRVMVIDLGSTNGTTVIVPGGRPEPLAAGGSRMIEPGTQVVLAEEVSLVYEVTT